MKRKTPFLILSALLCLAAQAAGQARPEQSQQPAITVTGQAEISVPPDEVVFWLVVEKTDKDLGVAKQRNDESVRQVLALARRFDVPAGDVKTDFISVEMRYTTDLAGELGEAERRRVRREFVGYEVSKTVIVRLANVARFEEFFSEVLKAGVSSVRGVDFRTSQIRKYKDQARAEAIRAAREKAVALTREIGQGVGKAVSISEGAYPDPRAYSSNVSSTVAGNFSDAESPTIAPGLIKVRAQVTVSFVLN